MDKKESGRKKRLAKSESPMTLEMSEKLDNYQLQLGLVVDELTDKNEQLLDTQQRLKDIISFLPVATFVIDLEHRVIAWNHAMERLTGIKTDDILGKGDYEYAIPFFGFKRPILIDFVINENPEMEKEYRVFKRQGDQLFAESYLPDLNQREIYFWGKATPLRDHQGRVVGAIECIRDITKETLAEIALLETQKSMAAIIDFLPDPMLVIDRDHRVIAWNQAMEQLAGVDSKKMLGKSGYAYAVPFYGKKMPMLVDFVLEPKPGLEQQYGILRREGDTLFMENFIPNLDGREVYLWAKASPIKNQNGEVVGAIETVRDISELKRAQSELEYLSSYDSLTGLYNRSSFDKALQRVEKEMIRPVTLIVCDVNGLKIINDEFGHAEGDRWLRLVSETIRGALRPQDMVARIGGDEYGILLPRVSFKRAERIVERINKRVKAFNRKSHFPHQMSVAIGKATAELPEQLVLDALRTADQNMYLDKMIKKQQL